MTTSQMNVRIGGRGGCVPMVGLLLFWGSSCARSDRVTEGPGIVSDAIAVAPEAIVSVDFAVARSNRLGVEDRTRLVKKVLLGGAVNVLPTVPAWPEEANEIVAMATGVREAVSASHDREGDDLLLVNHAVANDHSIDSDIGERVPPVESSKTPSRNSLAKVSMT